MVVRDRLEPREYRSFHEIADRLEHGQADSGFEVDLESGEPQGSGGFTKPWVAAVALAVLAAASGLGVAIYRAHPPQGGTEFPLEGDRARPSQGASESPLEGDLAVKMRTELTGPAENQLASNVDSPSVAVNGKVVFYTGNWYAARSKARR
jgi:hypothetical protein